MYCGKREYACTEPDLLRAVDQRSAKGQGRGDRFRRGGEVLADPALVVAEPVGQDHCFSIFFQDLRVVSVRPVDRLHKYSQIHLTIASDCSVAAVASPLREHSVKRPVKHVAIVLKSRARSAG